MLRLILIPLIFILGCATSYTPISEYDAFAENINSNEDIEVVFGFQGFGENNRFRDNFNDNNIAFMRLTITNNSNDVIIVNKEDVNLILKDDNYMIIPLDAESVFNRVALASYTYWLWGFLWVGYSKCEFSDCENSWYPVGLLIGTLNFFRATNTNSAMKEELVNNQFIGGSISPGEKISGYLFFDSGYKRFYDLQVDYTIENQMMSTISVPISF